MKDFELTRKIWTKKDGDDFLVYLKQFSKGEEKSLWEQRIVNTKQPCIAVPSPIVSNIVSKICKGNVLSFVDLWLTDNYTSTIILGKCIAKIKDFETMKKYITKYVDFIDCWGATDCLKINIKNNEENFFNLSQEYLKSEKTFVRRFGVIILFKFADSEFYIDKILKIIEKLKDENEYYVNMAVAWLVCECMIKKPQQTIELFHQHKLNNFVLRKSISKCQDSFRISAKDKAYLKTFRV